ncbi:MAG: M23 family metallopeptidase [Crocinitomicaceae bacterium]
MKNWGLLIVTIFSWMTSFAQPGVPIDTIDTEEGKMFIYANRTWEYEKDLNFDGVLCPGIHELVTTDTNFLYKSYWNTDVTITCTSNEVENMQDTLWLCTIDTVHNGYAIPFEGRITSRFGYRRGRNHNGIDIDLETGDTIKSAFDGKIRYAQMHEKGFGNLVIIRHYNGLETYYAHCSKLLVAPNQEVKAGDPIALGGNTGRSTGDHLHFEVRFYDNPINPEHLFNFEEKYVDDNLLVHSGIFMPGASKHHTSSSGHSGGGQSTYKIDKDARTHKVRSGDSLFGIALKYGTTVDKICHLNRMKDTDILQIGQVLKVKP